MYRLLPVVTIILAAVFAAAPARAQGPAPVVVALPSGWNMIGGPPGASFPTAQAVYAYSANNYSLVSSGSVTLCGGYWAYLPAPGSFPLTGQPPTSATQQCALQPGWNLVGNPFLTAATLPAGSVAYSWNPVTAQYGTAGTIAPGGAVWVYTDAAGSLSLVSTAGGATSVTINGLQPGASYTVKVGDTIELDLNAFGPSAYRASADPTYLTLESATGQGAEPVRYVWRWRAVGPGATTIKVMRFPGPSVTEIPITIQP